MRIMSSPFHLCEPPVCGLNVFAFGCSLPNKFFFFRRTVYKFCLFSPTFSGFGQGTHSVVNSTQFHPPFLPEPCLSPFHFPEFRGPGGLFLGPVFFETLFAFFPSPKPPVAGLACGATLCSRPSTVPPFFFHLAAHSFSLGAQRTPGSTCPFFTGSLFFSFSNGVRPSFLPFPHRGPPGPFPFPVCLTAFPALPGVFFKFVASFFCIWTGGLSFFFFSFLIAFPGFASFRPQTSSCVVFALSLLWRLDPTPPISSSWEQVEFFFLILCSRPSCRPRADLISDPFF